MLRAERKQKTSLTSYISVDSNKLHTTRNPTRISFGLKLPRCTEIHQLIGQRDRRGRVRRVCRGANLRRLSPCPFAVLGDPFVDLDPPDGNFRWGYKRGKMRSDSQRRRTYIYTQCYTFTCSADLVQSITSRSIHIRSPTECLTECLVTSSPSKRLLPVSSDQGTLLESGGRVKERVMKLHHQRISFLAYLNRSQSHNPISPSYNQFLALPRGFLKSPATNQRFSNLGVEWKSK